VRRFCDTLHGAVAFRSPHHVFEWMPRGLHDVVVPDPRAQGASPEIVKDALILTRAFRFVRSRV